MKRLLLLAVVLGVVLWSLPATAATPKPRAKAPAATDDADQEPPLVLKVYDVSDIQLAMPVPSKGIDDLDWAGSVNGDFVIPQQGPCFPGPAADKPRPLHNGSNVVSNYSERIDDLLEAINGLILGPECSGNGGSSEVTALGDNLAVSTTEKNHQKIATFLNALRQRAATRKMVAVEVHWLWLTEEQLKSLVPSDAGGDHATVRLNVDEAVWQRLAKDRAKEDSELRPGYHAAVTCMNGQTVLANGGSQKRFISTMIPVVGDAAPAAAPQTGPSSTSPQQSPASTGYQPVITMIQEGTAVQLKPIIYGNQVLLDIFARAVEVQKSEGGAAEIHRPGNPATQADYRAGVVRELASAVERPVVLNHRLDTTLRVPLGRRVLVGGITRSAQPGQGEPNLYVFVEVSIVDSQATTATPKRR